MSATEGTTVNVNVPKDTASGLATAAMVIGIIGLILAFIPIVGFISWILCPLAVVFGGTALFGAIQKEKPKGAAITGLITGIVGLLICMAWASIFGAAVAGAGAAAEEIEAENAAALEQL